MYNLEKLKLKSRDQNYHVSPPVSRDHLTALPLVEFLVM